ncbi:protein of unknown function [Streptomyces sp. KY75]|nr:protein of unknown function [Streptomyces sp. KY75]
MSEVRVSVPGQLKGAGTRPERRTGPPEDGESRSDHRGAETRPRGGQQHRKDRGRRQRRPARPAALTPYAGAFRSRAGRRP